MYKDELDQPDKLGAIVYAAMFTVYIAALVVLAIIGVHFAYFLAILIAGIPVSGVTLSLLQGFNWLKQQNSTVPVEESTATATFNPEYTNESGLPVIRM